MTDCTWRERAMLSEQAEGIAILAEALGYTYDADHGWVTAGDSLTVEVRDCGVKPAGPRHRLARGNSPSRKRVP